MMDELARLKIRNEVLEKQYFELMEKYREVFVELAALKAERRVGE